METFKVQSESHMVQLLPWPPEQSTSKTFRFTASDNEWKHGSKWANGIMLIIVGIIILVKDDSFIGVLFLVVGIIILVLGCILQNISCGSTYNISFDEEHYMVHLYSGSQITHSIPYNDFAQFLFETHEETYCVFICLGCWIRAGTGTYCGGVVKVVMKNSKQYRINSTLCYGPKEFVAAKRMVARANRYYKVDRHNIRIQAYKKIGILQKEGETQKEETGVRVANSDQLRSYILDVIVPKDDVIDGELKSEEEIEENRIAIGSYCYVDCDSVYGVVTGYLPNKYYTIVDLFEKKERRAFENSLTVIKDENVLNEVNKQYKLYLKK